MKILRVSQWPGWLAGLLIISVLSGGLLSSCKQTVVAPTAPAQAVAELPEPGNTLLEELPSGQINATSATWRSACNGSLPSGAVRVGYESYGPALYLVRAYYGGGLHPGKVRPGFPAAKLPYGGNEVDARCYDVFTGGGRWVAASGGHIPAGAIKVGYEAGGQALYAARARYGGGLQPGKVRSAFRAAKIPYGGKELDVWSYEVLVQDAPVSDKVLIANVPYKSQLDAGCRRNNLCGYASTLMLTSYLHGTTPTTSLMQSMARAATGSSCPARFSGFPEFLNVAKNRNLGNAPGSFGKYMSHEELKGYIRASTPVHIALRYGNLGGYRCRADFAGNHSVVVVGYSNSQAMWYIHDPYCSSNGAYREIPDNVFRSAIRAVTGNSVYGMVARR